jgi:hypothetical protein
VICCDTCPYSPTCEEEDDFLDQVLHRGEYEDADVDSR